GTSSSISPVAGLRTSYVLPDAAVARSPSMIIVAIRHPRAWFWFFDKVIGFAMSVRLEKQGGVGVIVLDRPPANSYDYAFLRSFAGAIDDARLDLSIKSAVVVTSASEKFFSAGA